MLISRIRFTGVGLKRVNRRLSTAGADTRRGHDAARTWSDIRLAPMALAPTTTFSEATAIQTQRFIKLIRIDLVTKYIILIIQIEE